MSSCPPAVRRSRSLLIGLAVAAATCLGALGQGPASASVRGSATGADRATAGGPVVAAPAAATASGTRSVSALTLTGTTTRVTVRPIRRSGQVAWVNHVVQSRLVDLDGCQARRSPTAWHGHVYRTAVYAVCPAGPGAIEAAAQALVRDRPWYQVTVRRVPLVGFTLLADLPSGNDRAVPAALTELPTGPAVFYEGDDTSLSYAGPGVTQAELDAAVAAFARALGISTSRVTVGPLG